MSVYCSVDEAWGPNFGRKNIELGYPSGDVTNYDFVRNTGTQRGNAASHVSFNQIPNGSGSGEKEGFQNYHNYYQDDEAQRFAKVPDYKQQSFGGQGIHNPNARNNLRKNCDYDEFNIPLGMGAYNDTERKPYKYYTFGDCDDNSCNFKDYDEEVQLQDDNHCIDILKHLTQCEACRSKISNELKKPADHKGGETKHHEAEEENAEIDGTEIALFISCGIFMIFLIDSIMKLGRSFGGE